MLSTSTPGAGHCSWALEVIQTAPATMTYLETQAHSLVPPLVSHHLIGTVTTSPPTSWSCFEDPDKSTLSSKEMTQKPKLGCD